MLEGEQSRIVQGGILNNLKNFKKILKAVLASTLLVNYNLWIIGIVPITVLISIIILAYQSNDKKVQIKNILRYMLLVLVAMGVCIVPIFLMERPSLEPRMCMSIGSIIGMSIIYLVVNLQDSNKNLQKLIETIIVILFIYNTINCINLFNVHITTNKINVDLRAPVILFIWISLFNI